MRKVVRSAFLMRIPRGNPCIRGVRPFFGPFGSGFFVYDVIGHYRRER